MADLHTYLYFAFTFLELLRSLVPICCSLAPAALPLQALPSSLLSLLISHLPYVHLFSTSVLHTSSSTSHKAVPFSLIHACVFYASIVSSTFVKLRHREAKAQGSHMIHSRIPTTIFPQPLCFSLSSCPRFTQLARSVPVDVGVVHNYAGFFVSVSIKSIALSWSLKTCLFSCSHFTSILLPTHTSTHSYIH